jgi:hypothetical protein
MATTSHSAKIFWRFGRALAALRRRTGIIAEPWDSSAWMKGYVDEMARAHPLPRQ